MTEERFTRGGTMEMGEGQDLPQPATGDPSAPVTMRPLFVPLKAEYFDAFESGLKTEELRRYGPRWNERTCAIGRRVVLSRGYGRQRRLTGRIWKFKRQHGTTFGSTYRAAIEKVYGTLDVWIACFGIDLEICLGCGFPTVIRDCGCPTGTGMRRIKGAGAESQPVEVCAVDPHAKVQD